MMLKFAKTALDVISYSELQAIEMSGLAQYPTLWFKGT